MTLTITQPLLKDITALDNGARFHNVDLHIHSYGASQDVKDNNLTPEAIVDAAVAQGLSVIAITDHNTDKNCAVAIAHSARHGDKILVLPGVEVTTAHGHLLVYFPPNRLADLSKFIIQLDLVGDPGADNTHTRKSMSDVISVAYSMDAICIAAHIDRDKTGFDKFTPGFQNWKKDIIISPGLYGLECDTVDAINWYSELDETTDAGANRRIIFVAREDVPDLVARHHLAHVQGSDSHTMACFQKPELDKPWTRIKLNELSFNALRVALVDPTARVRACGSIPRSFPRIIGIGITGGFLHGENIHFSDNLNCFIGGRGTGKSTAIRALAYAFGLNDDFGEFESCPDSVSVYCEDANGVFYRYLRSRGGEIAVIAKEDGSLADVPIDSFRIEYFGQGELAEVAKNPLTHPQLFQEFLDRHTTLRDLAETEAALLTSLRENAGRLIPLEVAFNQLRDKKIALADIEKKLKIAEEGNLRDVVGLQSKIASEKTIRGAIETIVTEYTNGFNFASLERDYTTINTTAGVCTTDAASVASLEAIRLLLDTNNAVLRTKAAEINTILKQCAKDISKHVIDMKANHTRMDNEIATKIAELKAKGLAAGNIAELEILLRQKTALGKEITTVEMKANDLKSCRNERAKLLRDLTDVREKMTERRKAQLKGINQNLAITIKDYTVFVKYDDEGIIDDFCQYMQEKMTGTYLHDHVIENICKRITPSKLSELIFTQDVNNIASAATISVDQAGKIVGQMWKHAILFELQELAKPPKPIITVRTKSNPPKDIAVLQLSDGQRHTILLTIAMLADSNVPLIIDQPEDDLDNAFIFTSIVSTLRTIKERRQVILVTHNANIAVLGDSELILPMFRENDCGQSKDRGSIDTDATKQCIQNIVEGGAVAFLRRKEIYGY